MRSLPMGRRRAAGSTAAIISPCRNMAGHISMRRSIRARQAERGPDSARPADRSAAVIDVSAATPPAAIIASPLPTAKIGSVPTAACPTVRSCCSAPAFRKYWPDRTAYIGTDERGGQAVAKLNFPGLSGELARFLVEQRKWPPWGWTRRAWDYGQSKDFIVHRTLLGADIPGFQNVAKPRPASGQGSDGGCASTKTAGGSGAPEDRCAAP